MLEHAAVSANKNIFYLGDVPRYRIIWHVTVGGVMQRNSTGVSEFPEVRISVNRRRPSPVGPNGCNRCNMAQEAPANNTGIPLRRVMRRVMRRDRPADTGSATVTMVLDPVLALVLVLVLDKVLVLVLVPVHMWLLPLRQLSGSARH